MTTLQERLFFSELEAGHSGPPIPESKRLYFQARLRNRMFNFILYHFVQEEKNGLTKAALARRIGKPPEMINRWLGTPSNLTLDTVSDLLLGICAEELTPQSEPLLDKSPQAMQISQNQVLAVGGLAISAPTLGSPTIVEVLSASKDGPPTNPLPLEDKLLLTSAKNIAYAEAA